METLKKRADFLRAARGPRAVTQGFILQMRLRTEPAPAGARIGFTCSKKVGNSVARNRAKRRLREIARLTLTPLADSRADYVLIGRAGTTARLPFAELQADLLRALAKLHAGRT